jgi:hypothetical protein
LFWRCFFVAIEICRFAYWTSVVFALAGGKGLCIAMAKAMKTFLAAFLVVTVAAIAMHAHNGEDHGLASAPHPSESGAATLVASLMAPLFVTTSAFVASALQL